MFLLRSVIILSAFGLVAACESTSISVGDGGREPTSRIVTLTASNELPDLNFTGLGRSGEGGIGRNINGNTNGFRWAYGSVRGTNEFLGAAGFYREPEVGSEIATGSITYNARYQLAITSDSNPGRSGDITLIASFDDKAVTGAADGLSVDGSFVGKDLNGSVRIGGVTADLDGALGTDGIVGAFAGHDRNHVLVGGFVGCTAGQTCPIQEEQINP